MLPLVSVVVAAKHATDEENVHAFLVVKTGALQIIWISFCIYSCTKYNFTQIFKIKLCHYMSYFVCCVYYFNIYPNIQNKFMRWVLP